MNYINGNTVRQTFGNVCNGFQRLESDVQPLKGRLIRNGFGIAEAIP